ncbi:hypothetical protein UlMin_042735 [Ulmus minor]
MFFSVDFSVGSNGRSRSFYRWKIDEIDIIYTIALIRAQMTAMLAMREHCCKKVPIIVHKESEQVEAWSQIFSEETTKQSIPLLYGNLQGFNKEKTAEKYGKEITHGWRKSYDIPPPNGESLEMCTKRTVVYFRKKYIPVLFISISCIQSGKHVMDFSHANSLRSIITSLDNLTSQEVINLEVSNGVPLLYIYKDRKCFRRGSPTEAGVYAHTNALFEHVYLNAICAYWLLQCPICIVNVEKQII